MEFSFGNTGATGRSPASRPNSGFLGPSAAEGQTRAASQVGDSIQAIGPGRPGSDWFGELQAWMEAHKYYPREAAMNGEDGVVVVHVTVDHTGHVNSVELRSRSGSQWLDLGAQAMFRGAHLPPFPPDSPVPDVDLQVTIHYIIIRH
jgi:TonB family protein